MTDDALARWWSVISGARWFGGKGLPATLESLIALPWLTPPDALPAVRPQIATVRYAAGRTEQYLLLVGHTRQPWAPVVHEFDDARHGRLSVVEAPGDPSCMRALLQALTAPDHPAMEWVDAEAVDPSAPTRVWPGEQSNTSICLGDDVLVKVFRKLEAGRNLDVEILQALNGSGLTPALHGAFVGDLPGGGRADFGMVVERVRDVQDGWQWACAACASERDISAEAEQLGHALRSVHERLAEAFGTARASGAEVAEAMRDRLADAQAQVSELATVGSSVELALQRFGSADLVTQRVHGDFHLGQTLRGAEGWTIIDFEGEPLKSLAERRRPDSVWRDVAGMLRSFDYVRGTHPDPASPAARAWCAAARRAFLAGYSQGIAPDRALLDAYELDKAVYEVVYEARNRPDWVSIPLGAIHEVAGRTALAPTPDPKEN